MDDPNQMEVSEGRSWGRVATDVAAWVGAVGGLSGAAALIGLIAGLFTTSPSERLNSRQASATSLTAFITVCNQRIKWEEQSGQRDRAQRLKRTCDRQIDGLDAVHELDAHVPDGPLGAGQGAELPAVQRRLIGDLLRRAATAPPAYVGTRDMAAEAAAFLLVGRNSQALSKLDRVLEVRPKDPAALNNRGVALLGLGKPRLAEQAFKKALVGRPHDPTVLANYALGALATGSAKRVSKSFLIGWTNSPDAGLQFARGAVLSRTTDLDAALAALDKSLQLDPGNLHAETERAVVWAKLNRNAEADHTFKGLLGSMPVGGNESAAVYYDYARYWIVHRDHPQALKWLGRSIANDPTYGELATADSDFSPLKNDPLFTMLTSRGFTGQPAGKSFFPASP